LADCKQAWMKAAGNTTAAVSRRQLQVLDAVRQLPGCSGATSEHLTDDGLFSIDIAVQLPGDQKLAVEVDGPTHFLSNSPTVPNGATRLCKRLARRERDGVGQAGLGATPAEPARPRLVSTPALSACMRGGAKREFTSPATVVGRHPRGSVNINSFHPVP
jgi:hypothetical protein